MASKEEYPVHSMEIAHKREIPFDPHILAAISPWYMEQETADPGRVSEWAYCISEVRKFYRHRKDTSTRKSKNKCVAVLILYEMAVFTIDELADIFTVKPETIRFAIAYARGRRWARNKPKQRRLQRENS